MLLFPLGLQAMAVCIKHSLLAPSTVQHIKKQRHHLADQSLYDQIFVCSSSTGDVRAGP